MKILKSICCILFIIALPFLFLIFLFLGGLPKNNDFYIYDREYFKGR